MSLAVPIVLSDNALNLHVPSAQRLSVHYSLMDTCRSSLWLRPHGGCLAVQVEASSRRLARPDTEAEVDGRQATAGRDLAPGRRTAAPVAGARRNRRGGHCQTRQPACQRLTAGPAAAPSAQATDRHLLLSPFHPRCQRFRRPSRDGMPHRWSYGPHDMGHLVGQRDRRERTDERDTPCHPTALCETADILRARSRNPSGPRSCGPHRKAGHMTALVPVVDTPKRAWSRAALRGERGRPHARSIA